MILSPPLPVQRLYVKHGDIVVPKEVLADLSETLTEDPASDSDQNVASSIMVRMGKQVERSPDRRRILASMYGQIRYTGSELSIESLVCTNSDRMSTSLSIYPKSAQGAKVTLDLLMQALRLSGVCFGINEKKIA